MTRTAAAPAEEQSTSSSRASAGHGSGSAGADRGQPLEGFAVDRRPVGGGGHRQAQRRGGRRQRRAVVGGSASSSRATSPSRSRIAVCDRATEVRLPRPSGPRSDDRTRRQASSLVQAIVRAASATAAMSASRRHSRAPRRLRPVPAARARCSADRCAVAARRARRATPRRPAEARVVVLEQDPVRGLRPVQRVHVAEAAAAFLQVGLEHERDFAGLLVARLDARGQRVSHRFARFSHDTAAPRSRVRRERRVAGDVARAQQRGRGVEIVVGDLERLRCVHTL